MSPTSSEAPPERTPSMQEAVFPLLMNAVEFVRARSWAVLFASAVALVPCFWHRHIQSSDLGSHLYNAWLAHLIDNGVAPGLHIVTQSSNVLFDLLLSSLFSLFGAWAAEHIAVSIAVLIFFWASFALCSVALGRAAWSVTPLLLMTCYGFLFHMGFFNLYLAVGLSLFGLAILWRGQRWDFFLLVPLTLLIWMAHPFGIAGLVTVGGFLFVIRWLPWRWQIAVTGLALLTYFVLRAYLIGHYEILAREVDLYWMAGADHFVVYRSDYTWIAVAVMILSAIVLGLRLYWSKAEALRDSGAWLQAYGLLAIAGIYSLGGIFHPKYQEMLYLPERISLYALLLMCVLLATLRPKKWQVAAFGVIAVCYFTMIYRDTAVFARREANVKRAVEKLPPGTRVLGTLLPWKDSRIHDQHMLDRACIGHCFTYANYEPVSGQFRIKADRGNIFVTTTLDDVGRMQQGVYLVKEQDLPLVEVYGCGPNLDDACLHPLKAGEYNGYIYYQEIAPPGYLLPTTRMPGAPAIVK